MPLVTQPQHAVLPLWFDVYLIDVAPDPVFARLQRLNQGMSGLVEMLGRVLARRSVAASHMPADQADAQVHPPTPCLQTLLAPLGVGRNVMDLIQMPAAHALFSVPRFSRQP